MRDGDRGAGLAIRRNGGDVDGLEQLADQHRGRQHGVVARVAADVAEVQPVARREQGFQQQVAVVEAPRAVAPARFLADQVEAGHRRATRQRAVVQAEQADLAERQAAHRHHGAEGHRAGKETRGAATGLQRGAELLAHQGQLQRADDAGIRGLACQRSAGLAEQEQGVAGFALVEQAVDQPLQVERPVGQGTRALQAFGQAGERADEGAEAPEQLPARAFQGVQRQAVAEQRKCLAGQLGRRGEAQQQAVQALGPGEGVVVRQTERPAVLAVAAPAHAGVAQPVAQQRQVFGLDAGAPRDGRLLQPGQHVLSGEAAFRQREQFEEGFQQRQLGAQAAVGEAERNARGGLPRRAGARGEHRLDVGRVAFDVRGQHHHLVRRQAGVGGEAREQLVVEDFHFAQRRMGDVQLQRTVVRAQRDALVGLARTQAQDVVLQSVQQAVVDEIGVFRIEPGLLAAVGRRQAEQAVEEVPPLLAEAGQQRVADIQIPFIRAQLRLFRQLADVADITPGLAARVEGEQHHLGVPAQGLEHAQVMRRQRTDAEHQQALGQVGEGRGVVQALQQVVEQTRTVRVAVGGQLAPEQRLPGFVGAEVAQRAALPGRQPVVAIEQVLVEHVGDLRRQRQSPAFVATLEVTLQALGALQVGRLAEPVVETPGQRHRGERRLFRQLAEHLAREVPDERRRQLYLQLHGDALLARQLQRQPAPDALARHHHARRREGVALRLGEQARGQGAEGFQIGSVVEVEHGCAVCRGNA